MLDSGLWHVWFYYPVFSRSLSLVLALGSKLILIYFRKGYISIVDSCVLLSIRDGRDGAPPSLGIHSTMGFGIAAIPKVSNFTRPHHKHPRVLNPPTPYTVPHTRVPSLLADDAADGVAAGGPGWCLCCCLCMPLTSAHVSAHILCCIDLIWWSANSNGFVK